MWCRIPSKSEMSNKWHILKLKNYKYETLQVLLHQLISEELASFPWIGADWWLVGQILIYIYKCIISEKYNLLALLINNKQYVFALCSDFSKIWYITVSFTLMQKHFLLDSKLHCSLNLAILMSNLRLKLNICKLVSICYSCWKENLNRARSKTSDETSK